MKISLKFVGHIFLYLWSIGFLTGCSELKGLRIANSRQAITIRDQLLEIDRLTDRLIVNRAVSKAEKGNLKKVVNKGIRAELERLAVSIGMGAILKETDDGPVIALPDEMLFDLGLAVVKQDGNRALGKIARHLRERNSLNLRIDGYSRLDPIMISKHGWVSNHHLSAERVLGVLHYFTEEETINPQRMFVVGYGSHKPQAKHSHVEDDEQKGRVEFLIFQ